MKVFETTFKGRIKFVIANNIEEVNEFFFNENGKVYEREDMSLEEAPLFGIESIVD